MKGNHVKRKAPEDSLFRNKKQKAATPALKKGQKVDYKDTETLSQFVTERGKIIPRRITGVSYNYQKMLAKAIRRARYMALLPFVGED